MKTRLILSGLILLTLPIKSQNNGLQIEDSCINQWFAKDNKEYQSSYHFGVSELESRLTLIIDRDSCYAQIETGSWVIINKKEEWIQNVENLNNVKILGNRFFSDKTNGEFVIFIDPDSLPTKGLLVYKPWSSWVFYANPKGQEIGFINGLYFPGKFPHASLRNLTSEELKTMTKSDLEIMRNEIYARYGYIFKPNGKMDKYFKKQSWYYGRNKTVDKFLTSLENRNIRLIQSFE